MKNISFILLILIIFSSCSLSPNSYENTSSYASNSIVINESIPKESDTVNNLPTKEEIQTRLEHKSFSVDLNTYFEPQPFHLINIDQPDNFFTDPSCNFMIGSVGEIQQIYDISGKKTIDISGKNIFFDSYIDANRIVFQYSQAERNVKGYPIDKSCGILTTNGEILSTNFLNQLLNVLDDNQEYEAVIWGGVSFDKIMNRFYVIINLIPIDDYEVKQPYIVCAEYNEEFELLSYIMNTDIELFTGNKGYTLTPSIIAVGKRKVYTNQKIEFDFNIGSYSRTQIASLKPEEVDNLGVISYGVNSPINKNENYLLTTLYNIKVLSYTDKGLNVVYETKFLNGEGLEIETDQGIIKLNQIDPYKNAIWAPNEGVYFVGECEKFAWDLPESLIGYLYEYTYEKAVFKLLPDESIKFVIPLPEDLLFIGEDIQNEFYFIKY